MPRRGVSCCCTSGEGKESKQFQRAAAEHGPVLHSGGEMNAPQRRAVLNELRRLGAARKHAGKPHNFDTPQMPDGIAKVEALLPI